MTARLYFSFRSPYSWLAVERLRQAIPDLFTRLELVPYWDPDAVTEQLLRERGAEFHYQQMSRAKHRYLLVDTKRLAARAGLAMAWPVDVDPWWEVPHLAWIQAHRAGAGQRCYDALMAARWGRGENICDPETFCRVTGAAGLDGAGLLSGVDSASVREDGAAGLARAYHEDVFGVPFLCLGRQRFWGLDRVEMFLETYAEGSPAPAELVPAAVAGYDEDAPGGCG